MKKLLITLSSAAIAGSLLVGCGSEEYRCESMDVALHGDEIALGPTTVRPPTPNKGGGGRTNPVAGTSKAKPTQGHKASSGGVVVVDDDLFEDDDYEYCDD
ncbi:hypothetical protein JRC04_05535 [Mycolicibacterium sp. S2-37]|uniref:hypothetical protein n=1 Tax=Mycolicibacterium sp. S2-37 TaxID=2810297 RepID=UPI001A94E14C|nr:hypothetical protein [Mycolicibacterium sp. S2-37]MBO0676918.1 hypothetical protein [Mycolicibacterium sp. S2-37]